GGRVFGRGRRYVGVDHQRVGGEGSWFHHRRSELMLGRESRYSSWLFLISPCEGGLAMNRWTQLTLTRRDGRGCCLPPFVSRAGWHTADAGDDRLGSPADKTGSAASFHCSHSLCRAFSPVTAVVSGIAVVRRSNEADAHGLEASCRHGRVGAPLETDAVAQSRRAGRARRHLTINPAEDRTRRSRGVDRGSYVRDASSRADRPRRRLLRSPQHRCRSAVFDGDTAITGPPMSEYIRVELDWRGRTVLVGGA